MSAEQPANPDTYMYGFERNLVLDPIHHDHIKANIIFSAAELLTSASVIHTREIQGLPYDPARLPPHIIGRVGTRWQSMSVAAVIPDSPDGLNAEPNYRIKLKGNPLGDTLTLRKSPHEPGTYDIHLTSPGHKGSGLPQSEQWSTLKDDDVYVIAASTLRPHTKSSDPFTAQQPAAFLQGIASSHPSHKEVLSSRLERQWDEAGFPITATLLQTERPDYWWRTAKKYILRTSSTLPINLRPGTNTYSCEATQQITYRFSDMYSKIESDTLALLESSFATVAPPPPSLQRQFKDIHTAKVIDYEDKLPWHIKKVLGVMSLAHHLETELGDLNI